MQPLGVYQKVGYKLGAWYDSGGWQGRSQPHSANPPAPKSMAEMQIGEWKETRLIASFSSSFLKNYGGATASPIRFRNTFSEQNKNE